jgi:Fe-S-cluster containining protein
VQIFPEELTLLLDAMDDDAWARVADSEAELRARSENAICPLIDPSTGGCSVYRVRPSTCRAYGVVSPRDWCWPEKVGVRDVATPMILLEPLRDVFGIRTHEARILGDELVARLERP